MSSVIALAGWPPEVLAYAFAMYSRSSLSIKESIKKITAEKTGKFLETFYFAYSHKSIADNAHIPLAFEDISQIAAFEIEDENLWDGQERSTRYQKFGKNNAFFIPRSIRSTLFESEYCRIAEMLLGRYEFFSEKVFEQLTRKYIRPQEMKADAYERTLIARAFDVSRYWLFGAIPTNVGQITSARTLEEQISRLMSSVYPELQELGQATKEACSEKPFSPDGKDEPPLAPTLLKYTMPSNYRIELRNLMISIAKNTLSQIPDRPNGRLVSLAPTIPLLDEVISTLLYEYSHKSYEQILRRVSLLSEQEKLNILNSGLECRGQFDMLSKAFSSGQGFQFDIVMDRGGERDLHRHRNCIQVHQALTVDFGWDMPQLIQELGLDEFYRAGMASVSMSIQRLRKEVGIDADYIIPFAFRSSTLYKMHLAQAGYMSELRSREGGHFSYREVACQMEAELISRYPFLKNKFRVVPFAKEDIFKR